jgi:hypothetical protein
MSNSSKHLYSNVGWEEFKGFFNKLKFKDNYPILEFGMP